MIPPWTRMACEVCGGEHLATRADPSDADTSMCWDCQLSGDSYDAGVSYVLAIIKTRIGIAASARDTAAELELWRLVADIRVDNDGVVGRVIGSIPDHKPGGER